MGRRTSAAGVRSHPPRSSERRRATRSAAHQGDPDGDDAPWDRDQWAAELAELAAQAEGVGARLGLEFFPWSNVKNLHDGLELVEATGHDAAGVIIDVWHVARAHEHRSLPVRDALGRAADSARRQLDETA